MLNMACKEWAIICDALGSGEQILILRKGGIAEADDGPFRAEHERFWLYPTFVHQQETGVVPEALPRLHELIAARPPAHEIHLQQFAEVKFVQELRNFDTVTRLSRWHRWSESALQTRFQYRMPGLVLLALRIYRIPQPHIIPVRPEYDGCKSWVPLAESLSTEHATPVLADDAFEQQLATIILAAQSTNR
ncbi:DUF1802 family protein [Tuwongella immobilis]|uniref:DUF1802 family protein n=1 Tax=Tuwongella immobilis TaxID=692036 RepID=A0A6C2YQD1_9BACT|nr:DUF1802 family protein [Tuwongella immobilis]VIP03531.1 Uncharacterized protein OS=Singulisphaera acidiphila (strain ATCC BAA-1392 / DSM 18658 / VKM B-2454 / MOB10) GN=Sinac_2702 PE=4 SV=1: DUF1802 [Tuwongella immobilis]VTS04430.1 Uncharacterized protein OS=Singulisphaera acidiphila (strain ATCC BAA-1392 / DSM 18658 / VKM B-2454 / MOB10) GN=Sinac_2702 PE=4 SV=1: DUF1802 [Tuwongella immobilis]